MARSTKIKAETKRTAARPIPAPAKGRSAAIVAAPVPSRPTKMKAARPVSAAVIPKAASARGKQMAPAPAAALRAPPASKGELRARIEKLEAANATLKAKSREANRAITVATRRVAELEEQITKLQEKSAKALPPAAEAKIVRRGRPPGRRKAIDPGDAVPTGAAVAETEPLDAEAEAARIVLEQKPLLE